MKGYQRGLARAPAVRNPGLFKPKFLVKAKDITITDPGSANAGFTAVIGDLPEGNFSYLGGIANLMFTKVSGGLTATFAGNISLGTTPTADATLSGSDVDLVPSTAITTAVSGVSAMKRFTTSVTEVGTMFDNTDGSLEINLNGFITDATISAEAVLRVEGVVQLAFAPLLDD